MIANWIDQGITNLVAGSILVEERYETNLRWANNALTTNGQMHSRKATVVVPTRRDDVSFTGPLTSFDDLAALIEQANASYLAPDWTPPANLVVDADFLQPAKSASIEVFADFAQGLGRGFATAQAKDALLFGFAELHRTTTWVATTAGTKRRGVVTMGRVELNAKSLDMSNSAWVGEATSDFSAIDVDALVSESLKRLDWGKTRIDLPPGRYETILPPSAVADFLIYAYWTMNGLDAREGRNVFSGPAGTTRVGERLSKLPISLFSDPVLENAQTLQFAAVPDNMPGMTSVRDNGESVARVEWMRDGTLSALVSPRTADSDQFNYPTWNLACDAGSSASLDDMIASTKRGLLLTCLWYIREVDPATLLLTGLTRDGVYLIEDGEIVGAVNNFRFNESPVSLLKRATEASSAGITLCREWNDWFTKTSMPSLRIPDFNMSTVSKAT